MSSFRHQDAHPGDDLLLRFVDGELPARKSRQVARHLEACWQCRAELDELQKTAGVCVRYRKTLEAHLPPPPEPWRELDFHRVDAELRTEPWRQRIGRGLGGFARPRLAIPALAAIAGLVFVQIRMTPAAQASSLLQKAVSAAETRPATPRKVRVRTTAGEWMRGGVRPVAQRAGEERVATLLAAARFDTSDPLSARAHQSWRNGLAQKRDEVIASASEVRIRTSTTEGSLRSATLTLRVVDYRPVEERLEFANQEWVEFSEVTEASTDGPLPAGLTVGLPERRAEPSRPAVVPSGSPASVSDELRVIAALHEIGADLGDPLEIARSGETVAVRGLGVPAGRQRAIREKLSGIPRVSVEFADPPRATGAAPAGASEAAGAGVVPGAMQAQIEKRLGGRAEFERFSIQAFDRQEALMARAYALRGLAQRFPASVELAMSPSDRESLRRMARQHLAVLADESAASEAAFRTALALAAGVRAEPRAAANWQAAVEDLFQSARQTEELLSALLGATPPTSALDRLPSDLVASLQALQGHVARCRLGLE